MRVLVAEDEADIAHSLKKSLEAENCRADIAGDGEIALEMLAKNDYDVLLLDWRMPKVSGLEVCRELRSRGSSIPIILLTALMDVSNKIEAFNVGADDYITKPFAFAEVLARLQAVLRRSKTGQNILSVGQLTLDLINHEVSNNGPCLKLPQMEFELLKYLAENRRKILKKEQLARAVWHLAFLPNTNFIEATVKNLRKKLEAIGAPNYIRTIYGEGYSLIDDEA